MKHYVLFYYVVADFLSRRAQYREKHLHLVQEANRRGQLILAGAIPAALLAIFADVVLGALERRLRPRT